MKITIPEEYRSHFQDDIVYLTTGGRGKYWKSSGGAIIPHLKKPSLLLMNTAENDYLQKAMGKSFVCTKNGTTRFSKEIIELKIENEMIDIPDKLSDEWLQDERRSFVKVKEKLGINLY